MNNLTLNLERYGFTKVDSIGILSGKNKPFFNISGGVQFEDYISGVMQANPDMKMVCNIQLCLRVLGLKDNLPLVGKTGRHHIFFNMLGHFAFYPKIHRTQLKKIMIISAYETLVDCGIKKISATCHPLDFETQDIWSSMSVDYVLSEKNLDTNPSGNRNAYRTEILYTLPEGETRELWNIVMYQFDQNSNLLDYIAADSGASVDRIMSAREGVNSNYENSNWGPFVSMLNEYLKHDTKECLWRIADLSKAIIELSLCVNFDSTGPGHVFKRVFRILIEECFHESLNVFKVLEYTSNFFGVEYKYLLFKEEITKYLKTIKNGCSVFEKQFYQNKISKELFFDRYGFPISFSEKILSTNLEFLNSLKQNIDLYESYTKKMT